MSRRAQHSHLVDAFEPLERRLLWAANLAPTSINGLVLAFTITAASGDWDPLGTHKQFSASADNATFQVQDGGSGTFTYARTSSTTAAFRGTDATDGFVSVCTFTFTSATAGTFYVTSPNQSGYESATFTITGTVKPLSVLSAGLLTVTGTVGDDTVSIVKSGSNIYVTQNNYTNPAVAASSVTGINVILREGSDALTIGAGVRGIYCDAGPGNDNLLGGDNSDTLTGGAGKDLIDGGLGDDRLNGSGSPDHLIGNAGYDRLYGGEGDDFCEGGGGVDRIWGGNGNDLLAGGGSNDKLFGEAGNDSLYGGTGRDILDGGADTDLAPNDGTDSVVNVP